MYGIGQATEGSFWALLIGIIIMTVFMYYVFNHKRKR